MNINKYKPKFNDNILKKIIMKKKDFYQNKFLGFKKFISRLKKNIIKMKKVTNDIINIIIAKLKNVRINSLKLKRKIIKN